MPRPFQAGSIDKARHAPLEEEFSPETEHLKVSNVAYDNLKRALIQEAVHSLYVNEDHWSITPKKAQERLEIAVAHALEPHVRALDVIRRKPGCEDFRGPKSEQERRRLIRQLRNTLAEEIRLSDNRVCKRAVSQLVRSVESVVFRVRQSGVELDRFITDTAQTPTQR